MARAPFAPPAVETEGARVLALPRRGDRKERNYAPWTPEDPTAGATAAGTAEPDPLEAARERAHQEGYDAGFAEGQAAAEAQSAALLETMRNAVEDLARLRSTLVEVYRREMVELALAVARAIVGRTVSEDANVVESWLDDALSQLDGADTVVVRCAPAHEATVRAWIERLEDPLRPNVTVAVDANLGIGDLRVECAAGSVDAILEQRLDRIRDLVLHSVAEERP